MTDAFQGQQPAYLRRTAALRNLAPFEAARSDFQTRVKLLRYVTMEQEAALAAKAAELADVRARLQAIEQEQAAEMSALRRTEEELRQHLADANIALASKHAEADHLAMRVATAQADLSRLLNSVSWRITAPLRAVASRHPGFGRWARRGLRLAWWTVTLQLRARVQAWQAARPAAPPGHSETLPAPYPAGCRESRAWYGGEQVPKAVWFSQEAAAVDHALFDQQSQALWRRYFPAALPEEAPCWFMRFGPTKLIRQSLAGTSGAGAAATRSEPASYSIITVYYRHRRFFPACAASVARLIDADFQATGERRIEWIVISDDPEMSEQELEALIPVDTRLATRVYVDRHHRGISARLNEAIAVARKEWLLFLDCDDLIEPQASASLDHYVCRFPNCRYISSDIIDIDDDGIELRRRYRLEEPAQLYEYGMVAGHLKAIRRDLFAEIGEFTSQFSGCQDYDFALRVAIQEPLLFVPDCLYSYRWHDDSVSVSRASGQNRLQRAVRQSFLLRYLEKHWPHKKARTHRPLGPTPRGLCLVRTQGARLDLITEALQSIWDQTLPVVPCIIVHEEADTFAFMQEWARRFQQPLVLLHAVAPGRRRGYPLNVGLEYALAHRSDYDFLCILDDDDIYYPLFAERLCGAMSLTGADLVFGRTNARSPSGELSAAHAPMPTSALVAGNFIPTNSFILHLDALLDTDVRFRENLHYLEDWHFLLSLLAAGLRFHAVWETIAEFRLLGDGNTDVRRYPNLYADCQAELRSHAGHVAHCLGLASFYRDLATFDFGRREPLVGSHLGYLIDASEIFESLGAGETLEHA